MDKRFLLIYAIILIDIVIGTAIWPILPELVKSDPNPAFLLSMGTAIFLGIQLFTAPLLGSLSDKYGRKPIFILSAFGTLFANLFLLFKNTSGYLLNRASDGMTNGVYSTIRASITDISSKENLAKNIGLEDTIVSVGFVIGPMLAGALILLLNVEGDAALMTLIVFGLILSVINIFLCYLFKETNLNLNKAKLNIVQRLNPFANFKYYFSLRKSNIQLFRLLTLDAFLVLGIGYYHYFITFVSLGKLQMNAKDISFFFAYMGVINMFVSYFFYTKIVHKVNPSRFISAMSFVSFFVLLSYVFVEEAKWMIYAIITIDCMTISFVPSVLESLIGSQTNEYNRGKIFGIQQMIGSLASIVTALVFGFLSLISIELPFYWFALCLIPLMFTDKLITYT